MQELIGSMNIDVPALIENVNDHTSLTTNSAMHIQVLFMVMLYNLNIA